MKKLFVLAFLIIMAFILINRQRVYVRDPLASVYQASPGQNPASAAKQHGVQVYINYSNDVLLIREDQPHPYNLLVQHWSRMPGTPLYLRCIRMMACLTDADRASTIPMSTSSGRAFDPKTAMTNREVSFVLPDGSASRVDLR